MTGRSVRRLDLADNWLSLPLPQVLAMTPPILILPHLPLTFLSHYSILLYQLPFCSSLFTILLP